MSKEKLIVFEGANEVGKSTLAALLYTTLKSREIPCELIAFPGNKIGTLGRHVYELHHKPSHFAIDRINPTSLQMLHIAAHIDAIEHSIKPGLREGRVIILDRSWWSTLIYGKASGVGIKSLQLMIEAERLQWDGTVPDAVFLVTRALPVGPLYDMEAWRNLADNYAQLANEETTKYRINTIENDGTIDEAFNKIQSLLHWFDEFPK